MLGPSAASPLSWTEHGDPTATPLVLLPGAGAAMDGWGPLATDLAKDHRLICVGYRGMDSPAAATPLTMASAADDVAAVLDRLAIRQAHVLGWSFGSGV